MSATIQAPAAIAAVLDNLPRDVMADAIRSFAHVHRPERSCVEVYDRMTGAVVETLTGPYAMAEAQRSTDRRNADAAISAAKREMLGHE